MNILVFQKNGKQPYSFPVLSRFCNCLFFNVEKSAVSSNSVTTSCIVVRIVALYVDKDVGMFCGGLCKKSVSVMAVPGLIFFFLITTFIYIDNTLHY